MRASAVAKAPASEADVIVALAVMRVSFIDR
jgi:hypothetical protein